MAGEILELDSILVPDQLGTEIAEMFSSWDRARDPWKREKRELREYVYARHTDQTANRKLPWNNKTHIPKLCQISDNLIANYQASMFPKRKWTLWEGSGKGDEDPDKVKAIKDYMQWVISQRQFKEEINKLVYDYVHYGNSFGTTEWVDESTTDSNGVTRPGFVGPRVKRISPLDIVLNPIAPSAKQSPKIIRSIWNLGEAKLVIDQLTKTPEEQELAGAVFEYMKGIRNQASSSGGEFKEIDEYFHMDGFGSYKEYLGSNYVEILTFYGNYYDKENNELLRDSMIVVVDRHKVIVKRQHPKRSGEIPIHHAGWRIRQDNIWAMGPLDNLVGMQYRIDHVENLKADLLDLTIYPPIKIKGIVPDFEWAPFEKIYVDTDGDVELMSPKTDSQTANIEIQLYEQRMEEMAGSPKEAMGFRTPGEKTKYEVQRLENAAGRIFQSKINQFEESIIEPLLNDMLALARENLTEATIRIVDEEFKGTSFRDLTSEDLSAQGRLKPVAARHFAEQSEQVQNLNNFFSSPMGQNPSINMHFSGVKLAKMMEEILELEDHNLVTPYIQISEQAEAQAQAQAADEQLQQESQQASGVSEGDVLPDNQIQGLEDIRGEEGDNQ